MKALRVLLTAMLIFAVSALGQGAKNVAVATARQAQASQAAPTLASAIDREIGAEEKQVLEAAEAMPEDKFNFSPEGLNLPAGDAPLPFRSSTSRHPTISSGPGSPAISCPQT
jgi:hypothetical protein